VRPDLPESLRRAVASALTLNPARRPSAEELAAKLRAQTRRKKQKSRSVPAFQTQARTLLPERVAPAVLAAIITGWTASTLAFYPPGWAAPLAAAAAGIAFWSPRAGTAFAFGGAFFPLANISLGLAGGFAVIAVAWMALTWRDPRAALVFVAGPLLAPLSALALLPLVAQTARGGVRRGLQASAAVLVAAVVSGLEHGPLPFGAGAAPLGLGIAGSTRPGAASEALVRALTSHPALLAEAIVIGAAAAVLPLARGIWPASVYAAGLLAATAFAAPATALAPLAAAAWITAAILALSGPTTKTCSWFRRWDTRPTRSPRGL
jgi:hypothetical protein